MVWDVRIDGDTLLCRAGFSADTRSAELSHSLYNCKLIIEMIMNKFPGTLTIFLSNNEKSSNFRYDLTKTYKSNRILKCKKKMCLGKITHKPQVIHNGSRYLVALPCSDCDYMAPDTKPVHYQAIREYLIDRYKAIVVEWGEADDWLGVDPKEKTVIVSNDKDLLMLPAYHYRLSDDKLLQTSDPGQVWLSSNRKKILGGGFKWFCCQLLMGDAVDGIKKPTKGYGPVKVYDTMQGIQCPREMWNIAASVYKSSDDLLLNAQLLWISRKPNQIFSFELLEELLVEIENGLEKTKDSRS